MATSAPLMAGKKGLIMGIANDRSLAWGIARAVAAHGAELALTYQGEALGRRVLPLAEEVGAQLVIPCDVADEASLDAVFSSILEAWGALDFVVHAIAYSDKEQLKSRYCDTTADNFATTLEISCYSFTAVVQRAVRLMQDGGSLLTLTYYGAEKVVPHYNVMGVAKAALEASVRYLLTWNESNAPLKRNVTIDDVGGAALYLLSDLGCSVTGEVHHVDAGYHIVGMKAVDAPDIATV